MRLAFVKTLCELAERDERVWLVNGDLGYSVLEGFAQRFPERYLNAGVAEQNMTGIAAGLAMSGNVVFVYSIGNFPVIRCLEQVRNDVCYHKLNVKVVAVGGGLSYGSQGYTHHAVEDLAMMRVLPHMAVFAPGDPVETALATQATMQWDGPCYLRLGKAGEPVIHTQQPKFAIGSAIHVREGDDATIITTGGVLGLALAAADKLAVRGVQAQVISMPTLQPIDEEAIVHAAKKTKRIVTVEEHGLGGLGSAVAEVLAERGQGSRFHPIRLRREPAGVADTQAKLRAALGVSEERVCEVVSQMVRGN